MDSNNNHSERFEFVGEMLNGEELLERLAGAQEVVQALTAQVDARDETIKYQRAVIAWRNDRMERFQAHARALALDLARSGSYDHKGKSERMLSVIASLLEMAIIRHNSGNRDEAGEIDTIPF